MNSLPQKARSGLRAIHFSGLSLLWRILISTALAITLVFALTGWMIQRYAASISQHSIEEEIQTSLQAYQSLWSMRVRSLTAVSRIISSMSDVRAAFMTRDRATIRDTAGQLWSQISEENANFLVLDATGSVIASLGGDPAFSVPATLVEAASKKFPNQVSGYLMRGGHLFYVVFTPVYVQATEGQALIDILLIAFDIDNRLAASLKASTHGSDFAFLSQNRVIASTLPPAEGSKLQSGGHQAGQVRRLQIGGVDHLLLEAALKDPLGGAAGQLFILRSTQGADAVLNDLKGTVAAFWTLAILVALALTFLLSRRILQPVKQLDRAAGEVIRRNYNFRVPVETDDELGRLAATFNTMCESIQSARDELILQEQISTIGRLSSSIVHDLRNPLAAIYGGAEMLIDAELSPEQSRRLAVNIYSASRRIQELLQELDVSRAIARPVEAWPIQDMVRSAVEIVAQIAELQGVSITIDIPERLSVLADRNRLERVFVNLLQNSLDVMPEGGLIRVTAREDSGTVIVKLEDSGPGIPDAAWTRLFQPFATFGKKNGLGLGLALSRQTILEHGGDLWADKKNIAGAAFLVRLPLLSPALPKPAVDGSSVLH